MNRGLRLTEEQIAQIQNRMLFAEHNKQRKPGGALKLLNNSSKARSVAPGQTPAGVMNKTEKRFYDEIIWPGIATREITESRYESEKFKIAPRTFYTPDFSIIWSDPKKKKTYVEIKGGFIREKASLKFKATASKYPEYNWKMWQYTRGAGWKLLFDL
jgi:hypothetical protein